MTFERTAARFLAMLVILSAIQACKQKPTENGVQASSPVAVAIPAGYYHLTGNLGDIPIVIDLVAEPVIDGETFRTIHGSFYYTRYQQPITLSCSETGNSLKLDEYITDQAEPNSFELNFEAPGVFTGTWKGNGKSFDVRLENGFKDGAHDLALWCKSDTLPATGSNGQRLGVAEFSQLWLVPKEASIRELILKAQYSMHMPENQINSLNYQELYNKEKTTFMASFQQMAKEFGDDSPAFNASDFRYATPLFNAANLLTLSMNAYEYSPGAAHGNFGATLCSYDLEKKARIALEDLFEPGFEVLLNKLIEARVRTQLQIPEGEPLENHLLVDAVTFTNNFGLTGKGILFVYNPYEIAAYAYGEVPVFVSFEEMKAYAKPQFLSQN